MSRETEKVLLVPREGAIVRDPITMEPLPEAGARKPLSRYWRRRMAEGSCSELERIEDAED